MTFANSSSAYSRGARRACVLQRPVHHSSSPVAPPRLLSRRKLRISYSLLLPHADFTSAECFSEFSAFRCLSSLVPTASAACSYAPARLRLHAFRPRAALAGDETASPSRILSLLHLLRQPHLSLLHQAASRSPSARGSASSPPDSASPDSALSLSAGPSSLSPSSSHSSPSCSTCCASPEALPVAAATAHALALAAAIHSDEEADVEGEPTQPRSTEQGAGDHASPPSLPRSLSVDVLQAFLEGSWQSILAAVRSPSPSSLAARSSAAERLWLLSLLRPPLCDARVNAFLEACAQAGGLREGASAEAQGETSAAGLRDAAGAALPLLPLAASLFNLGRRDLLEPLMVTQLFPSLAAYSLSPPLLAFFAKLYVQLWEPGREAGRSSPGSGRSQGSARKAQAVFFGAICDSLSRASSPSNSLFFTPDDYVVCLQALALFHYVPRRSFPLELSRGASLDSLREDETDEASGAPPRREEPASAPAVTIRFLRHPEYAFQLHAFDSSELNEVFVRGLQALLRPAAGEAQLRSREDSIATSLGEKEEKKGQKGGGERDTLSLESLIRLTDTLLLRDAFMREHFSLIRDKQLSTASRLSAAPRQSQGDRWVAKDARLEPASESEAVLKEMNSFWSVYTAHQEAVLERLVCCMLHLPTAQWKLVSPLTILNLLHALLRLYRVSPDCLGASERRRKHRQLLLAPLAWSSSFEAVQQSENEPPPHRESSQRNALWASTLKAAVEDVSGPGAAGALARFAASPASFSSSASSASPSCVSPDASPAGEGTLSAAVPPVFLLFERLIAEVRTRAELRATEAALLLDAASSLSSHPFTRSFFLDSRMRAGEQGVLSSFSACPPASSSALHSPPQSSTSSPPPSSSPSPSSSPPSSSSSSPSSVSSSSSTVLPVVRRAMNVDRLAESFFSLREVAPEIYASALPLHAFQESRLDQVTRKLALQTLRALPLSAAGGAERLNNETDVRVGGEEGEPQPWEETAERTPEEGGGAEGDAPDEAGAATQATPESAPLGDAASPWIASRLLQPEGRKGLSASPLSAPSRRPWACTVVDDALLAEVAEKAVLRDVHGLSLPAALLLLQALRDLQAFERFSLFELVLANVLREAHRLQPPQIVFLAATLHGLRHALARSMAACASFLSSASRSADCQSAGESEGPRDRRALYRAKKEHRELRRRLKAVTRMQKELVEMFLERQEDFLKAPKEFAAIFYVFSKSGLMTLSLFLKLQPHCQAQLARFSPHDLSLFFLGFSLACASPAAPGSAEFLSSLFSALSHALPSLSPRDLAVCFWCMYAVGCIGSASQPAFLRELVDSGMQRIHRNMRSFSPKELLLVASTVGRLNVQRQPILLDLFRALYAFLPLYDAEELAAAFFAFGRGGIWDDAVELRFLHCLSLALPVASQHALAQIVLGFYSLDRAAPTCQASPLRAALFASEASVAARRESFRAQLLSRLLQSSSELSARHLATVLICAPALRAVEADLRVFMRELLRSERDTRAAGTSQAARIEGERKIAAETEAEDEPERGDGDEGDRGPLAFEASSSFFASSDSPSSPSASPFLSASTSASLRASGGDGGRRMHAQAARRRTPVEEINKLCSLSAVELVRILQSTARLEFFPAAFVKCLLFALRKKAANLDSLQLLSAVYALDQLGYAPFRLRWRLGSLLKERTRNYGINMSDLLAAAPAMDRVGIFHRLDVKLQHEVYHRLDEEARRIVSEPLSPPDPSEAETSLVIPRARNLALLQANRMERGGPVESKFRLLFPRKKRESRTLPAGFLEIPCGADPRDAPERDGADEVPAWRGSGGREKKSRKRPPPSPEEEEERQRRIREETASQWGAQDEEKHAAEIFREAIRRL
ncbi:hypothetical protein BESB_078160 [Besnoitia besnoiti]|uniref:Uncharacterized protein n=1 Tax=Besnoitia besnoiti TaxID=94643 RepID=A0A2A9MDZ1_BESBE|nr:hypothetical protein BESB_078160 [Besnoitia besnoiti]PFH33600.1 hypothetical protein BESB_078160 [Besnoitia besnoiti]